MVEYDLILENDTNTNGYNQWFFFMMTNISKGTTVRLNLVNMENPWSFYASGLKPTVLSLKRFKATGYSWQRAGEHIRYDVGSLLKTRTSNWRYYTLSFSYTFEYVEDVVYFAMNFPYSYSKIQRTLADWSQRLG